MLDKRWVKLVLVSMVIKVVVCYSETSKIVFAEVLKALRTCHGATSQILLFSLRSIVLVMLCLLLLLWILLLLLLMIVVIHRLLTSSSWIIKTLISALLLLYNRTLRLILVVTTTHTSAVSLSRCFTQLRLCCCCMLRSNSCCLHTSWWSWFIRKQHWRSIFLRCCVCHDYIHVAWRIVGSRLLFVYRN